MEHLLKAIREANYTEANSYVSDMLYQKLNDKLEDRLKEMQEDGCGCEEGVAEALDPVDKKELKGKHKDRDDKDIDNDGDVDSSDKYLHKRRKAVTKAVKEDDEKDFKPHMMYDPKTGKGYQAKTYQDHLRMDKMGYTHKKNEIRIEPEMREEKMKGKKSGPMFKERGKHDCATHVNHEQFGEGQCIHSQHASPDENGNIAWYDVMFEHGIEKGVSINELKVVASEMHEDHHDEGAEMDIAKEKEKMAASQEKMRDLAIKLKKEKQRKRAEA